MVFGCKEEVFELGEAPTPLDADFTFAPSSQGENYITFTNDNPKAFLKVWDFGNGTTSKQSNPTAYYPFAGDYTVKLTVYTSGGSISATKIINIPNTDPSICTQENLLKLTGGCDAINGKTWVIDKDRPGHFGVGPANETSPIWYAAAPNEKQGGGMYDDEYTFFLNESKFIQQTNGNVYVNPANSSKFTDISPSPVGDLIANYNAPEDLNYSLTVDQAGNLFLNLTNGGFIGYYTGVSSYQILSINENEMFIKFKDAANPALAWFHRLIRKGYTPEPPSKATLPINFENIAVPFSGFGGSNFEQVDNPDKSGINTSAKVGKTAKGSEVWAGTVVTLDQTIDFSSKTTFHMKVWSPVTGVAKLKLEKAGDNSVFKEVDVNITKTNTWEELVFDFSGEPSNTYSVMAVFFDFGNPGNGNVFYFDDIIQTMDESLGLPITFETASPAFISFGGASFNVIDNPDATGINTSAKVGEIDKSATSEVWAGIVTDLPSFLDFTSKKTIKVKVWSPNTGAVVRLKIENSSNSGVFIEKDQTITTANTWQELTWDFSEAAKDTYNRVAFFIDFGQQRAGKHYFDDMKQE
ncbi:MAG: hypothetical protein OHK0038_03940 [Flammeovirgaceae bacterium]